MSRRPPSRRPSPTSESQHRLIAYYRANVIRFTLTQNILPARPLKKRLCCHHASCAFLRRYFADEEVGGLRTPSRGTETCSIVETMFSMRVAYEITGEIGFMDRLEQIAFNSLPAALWPDVTANVYHHATNQLETGSGGPYAYDLYFCCSANVHQGWPKFLFSAVHTMARDTAPEPRKDRRHSRKAMETEPTVVVSGYAPSVSTLSNGAVLTIAGSYPFSDVVVITVSIATGLRLRVPCWSQSAKVTVSGITHNAVSCAFFDVPAGPLEVTVRSLFSLKPDRPFAFASLWYLSMLKPH